MIKKIINFFVKSIYLRLAFEKHCFHGHAENDVKCSYILFLIKCKTRSIILKTEQTTIVYAQWNRWTYDVIKHHMITTNVILKYYINAILKR